MEDGNKTTAQLLEERFFRGERSSALQASGTGLGLMIVKAVAELHGGQVFVESVEGVGSAFTVWLPAFSQVEEEGALDKSSREG